jgi:tRNA(fMet)-specific endonuclease VapC
MTGNNLLLDTSIIIELFKGNAIVTQHFKSYTLVNIPFTVLGELYFGAYRSSNPEKHLGQINSFLANCNVLIADKDTANNYAIVKTALLSKGKPIPENDIWIAAIARQHELTLITKDSHFNEVDDLTTENWQKISQQ